jgi:autotransporter-associated beta strand protein/probable HAF family extracellular repeat protein
LNPGNSTLTGINDAGQIVGYYDTGVGTHQGFLLTITPATPAAPTDSAIVNGYVNAAHDTAAQALTGTAENGSTVTVYDNGNFVGSTTADASTGTWSFPIGHLADGTYSFTVTATDGISNVSQPSAALNFTVDTTIPAVTAITETSGSGSDLNAGKTVTVTLSTSEAVMVTGRPTATLNDGGTATYDAGKSTATSLVFDYTVASSDSNVPSLQVSSLNLPSGATIQDGGGNNLNLSLSPIPTYSGPQIDTTIPFQGLGVLPGSNPAPNAPQATAVTADGSVVVGYSKEEAFSWTQSGGMAGLGFLNPESGFTSSYAEGVSGNGGVVVGYSLDSSGNSEAFNWTQTGGLVGLGFLPGGVYSTAFAVNSDGSVIVGTSNTTANSSSLGQAFRWTQNDMVGLGYLPGDNYSDAFAVSASGSVIVGRSGINSNPLFTSQAFSWTQASGMVGLGYLPGGTTSAARGVSSDGSVIVGFSDTAFTSAEAFRWTQGGGMIGLGFLPGDVYSFAYGTNGDGSVVVGYSEDASYNPDAYRWSSSLGVQSIEGILQAEGQNLSGWTLYSTNAVSADGQVIAGYGSNNGTFEPWVAQIPVNAFALLDLQGVNHSLGSLLWGGTVTNNGVGTATLTVGSDNTSTTFNGTLQDGTSTTALIKVGAGTLTLEGISTYTGGTTITAGTLAAAAVNAFSPNSAYTVTSGGTLDLGGFNQQIGSLGGSGVVTNNGGSAATLTTADATDTTFSGVIKDGTSTTALTKIGGGTLLLTNAANSYSGLTSVNSGILAVTGDISASSGVAVNTGGALEGTGTVASTTVNSGGTLVPGYSLGTMAVSGNLILNNGADYSIQVSSSAASETIVTGTASVAGIFTVAPISGNYSGSHTYTVLHSTGLLSGTFSSLTPGSGDGATFSLSYDAHDVFLTVVVPSVTSITATTDNGAADLNAGHAVTISLSINEAAYVAGSPFLLLNDNEIATYTGGSGTDTLKFTYTVQQGDNTQDLRVTGLNLNGGTIQDSAGTALSGLVQGDLALQIDTTPPSAPATPTDSAVVNGYVNAANDTAAQALTGSADNGSTVTVYDNNTQVGTTKADASTGIWSFPIGQLADTSTHSYTVTATDAAGNVSQPSAPFSFTVDTTTSESAISDLAVTTGTDGKSYINAHNFNGGSTTLTGTAEAGDAVSVSVNGGSAQAATVAPSGTWSLPLSGLSDGESVSVVATATDPAGNTATSAPFSFTVETDAGEQAALKLTVATTAISAATAPLVSFSVTGLESEDTGTVTFTDANHKTIVVNVNGSQTSYTANLSSLADGTITSSLAVNVDTAGNTFTAVPGTDVTLTQLDHWSNTSGGNWTTASSWATWNGTHAVPTGTIDADFDKSGTYTVKITTADTAYALLLKAAGTTISDNSGGTLTLAGTGGSSNPNGPLSINAGNFALAGGALNSGAISIARGSSLTISGNYTGNGVISQAIADNGTMTISGSAALAGAITGSGIVNIQKGAAATFTGTITGSETFNISGTMTISGAGRAVISTLVSGTGSFILSNSASLEFAARDSENITFSPGATGSVKFDDSLNAQFFTGQLSGLSTLGGNSVDLADLLWAQGKMSASYKGTPKGGTLTISNGTNKVALNLLGNYIGASWMLSQDGGAGTLVKDPPVTGSLTPCANGGAAGSIDLSGISFGTNTTLGYSPNSDNTGGTLTASDGLHAQSVALLGQYMASSFVMASDGHGGTLITETPSNQQPFLTHPHA